MLKHQTMLPRAVGHAGKFQYSITYETIHLNQIYCMISISSRFSREVDIVEERQLRVEIETTIQLYSNISMCSYCIDIATPNYLITIQGFKQFFCVPNTCNTVSKPYFLHDLAKVTLSKLTMGISSIL